MSQLPSSFPGRLRSRSVFLLAAAIAGLVARASDAQQYGQWWWDGQLRSRYRVSEVSDGSLQLSTYREKGLHLDLGLNGYLGHPVLGSFRVGLSGGASDYPLPGRTGTRRSESGERVELRLLPRGRFPLTLFAGQQSWRYPKRSSTVSEAAGFLPSDSRSYGGKLRLRAGPLTGTVVGFSRSELDFEDSSDPGDSNDEATLGWNRQIGAFNNSLRVRDASRTYGHLDYRLDDGFANFVQQATLGPRWVWNLNASRVSNRSTIADNEASEYVDYRLSQQSTFEVSERQLLDLNVGAGYQTSNGDSGRAWQAGAFYLWRAPSGFRAGPFVQYSNATGQARATQTTVGLTLSDLTRAARWDLSYSTRVGLGLGRERQSEIRTREDRLAYSIQANAGRGALNRARLELDLSAGRSQVDFERRDLVADELVTTVPSAIGRDDFVRGQARLYRQRGNRRLGASTEFDLRQTTPATQGERVDSETYLGTFDFGLGSFSALLSGGSSEQRRADTDTRTEVRFAAARASFRVRRFLSVSASYRLDEREVAPSVILTTRRLEADVALLFGEWNLHARAWDGLDELSGGNERGLRGVEITLGRSVAGWLPIVTGGGRRGTIR